MDDPDRGLFGEEDIPLTGECKYMLSAPSASKMRAYFQKIDRESEGGLKAPVFGRRAWESKARSKGARQLRFPMLPVETNPGHWISRHDVAPRQAMQILIFRRCAGFVLKIYLNTNTYSEIFPTVSDGAQTSVVKLGRQTVLLNFDLSGRRCALVDGDGLC